MTPTVIASPVARRSAAADDELRETLYAERVAALEGLRVRMAGIGGWPRNHRVLWRPQLNEDDIDGHGRLVTLTLYTRTMEDAYALHDEVVGLARDLGMELSVLQCPGDQLAQGTVRVGYWR